MVNERLSRRRRANGLCRGLQNSAGASVGARLSGGMMKIGYVLAVNTDSTGFSPIRLPLFPKEKQT
jgi:hypothetical protein